MGLTTDKGEIGEAETIADLRRRGHGVAVPFGHSLPFDLVLVRGDDGVLERVQVKYTTSDGRVIKVRCVSYSAWVSYRYRASMVDWIAVFDTFTDQVYYIHSCEWDGLAMVNLRLGRRQTTRRPSSDGRATFSRLIVTDAIPHPQRGWQQV